MFTLAHLSDVHLGPLPPARSPLDYLGKRTIGWCSWHLKRKKIHDPRVAAALAEDVKAHAPDHIAVTGDLVNIALDGEFAAAADWLRRLGPPDRVSLVPGNHDAYVDVAFERGLRLWADYMKGDLKTAPASPQPGQKIAVPYVRHRRNIALIGLSSALPQGFTKAGGELGLFQLNALAAILEDLKARGFCRVVLIHHPALPGLAPDRKALTDAAALKDVLKQCGAELVLHGHNHRFMNNLLGNIRVLGAPSASARSIGQHPPAGWLLHRIVRKDGVWRIDTSARAFDAASSSFHTVELEAATKPG